MEQINMHKVNRYQKDQTVNSSNDCFEEEIIDNKRSFK